MTAYLIYILPALCTVVVIVLSTIFVKYVINRSKPLAKPHPAEQETKKPNNDSLITKFKDDYRAGGDSMPTCPFSFGSGDSFSNVDPAEYCDHIQGEVKKAQHRVADRKIQEDMTTDQIEAERKIQRDQLAAIFTLMQTQEDKFGISSMDEMQSQMNLYN